MLCILYFPEIEKPLNNLSSTVREHMLSILAVAEFMVKDEDISKEHNERDASARSNFFIARRAFLEQLNRIMQKLP